MNSALFFLLEIGKKLRDAGFSSISAPAGDHAAGDCPVVAADELLGGGCRLLGARHLLGELFGKRFKLGKNGLVFGPLAGITAHSFCG